MTPDAILACKPKALSQKQREAFFEDGFLALDSFVEQVWLDRLWQVTQDFIEESRTVTESNGKFDLEADHTSEKPRLRRLSWPVTQHEIYWEFASHSPIVDVAEDLLGPDVVFHHSNLNFKWSGGGEEVKWHQDFPFYPHSNRAHLAIGLCLSDVDGEMGPLGAIPGSQKGRIYDHYGEDGEWAGALRDVDIMTLPLETVQWLKGKAGTVTVHNVCTLHGSLPNTSPRMRPLLLNAYGAADAIPLTHFPKEICPQNGTMVRGRPANVAHFDLEECRMPPDWSGGYTSIFAAQQDENSLQAAE